MPSRARCRCLRNTPSVTSGNIDPAPATAVPFVPHKNPHSAAPQKHQTRAPPAPGPIFRKMDVPPSAATRCGQSRLAPVVAALFVPSPYAQCTNSRCGLCSKFLSRNLDFHHRLLVLLCYKKGAPQKGQPESCRSRTRAMVCRRVAIDQGLCRSARTGRTPRTELAWQFGGG